MSEETKEVAPETQAEAAEATPKKAKKAETAEKAPAKKPKATDDIMTAIKNMTVLELAELVKALESEFGVSAAVPVAAAAAAAPAEAAAEAAVEQTEFSVILKEIGANKINVIKVVREITALGLREAKELVEGVPKEVKAGVTKEEAAAIRDKLQAVGAGVEVK